MCFPLFSCALSVTLFCLCFCFTSIEIVYYHLILNCVITKVNMWLVLINVLLVAVPGSWEIKHSQPPEAEEDEEEEGIGRWEYDNVFTARNLWLLWCKVEWIYYFCTYKSQWSVVLKNLYGWQMASRHCILHHWCKWMLCFILPYVLWTKIVGSAQAADQ